MASSSKSDAEITKSWADLCIDEEEELEAVFDVEEGEEDIEPDFDDRWCLVGKLLTGKISDYQIFQNIMADLWKPGKGLYVKILEPNRFLFQFFHEIDIQRVINGSPWTFDRKQLIIERLKPGMNPKHTALNTLDMWVQIHDLQLGFRTEKAIREAGRFIGEFIELDPNNFSGVWRDYFRIQIRINITLPLKRRMKFRKRDQIEKPYGIWMKAPNKRQNFLTASPWLRTEKNTIPTSNNDGTVDSAGTIIPPRSEKPKFVFLCETLCDKTVVNRVKNKLGYEACYSVDAIGRSGGLAIFWKITDEAQLLNYTQNHISLEIHLPNLSPWRLTGFYGEPNRSFRSRTWTLIRTLYSESQLPWCVIGDLNNISSNDDKRGGRPYPSSLIQGSQDVLHDCHLHDLELRGYQYTWERGRQAGNLVEIRLDRSLVSQSWLDFFPEVILSNLAITSSDHSPIFLDLTPACSRGPVYRFRFENVWSHEPMCAEIVRDCWNTNGTLSLSEKIKLCSVNLSNLGKTLTGNFTARLNASKKKMATLKMADDANSVSCFENEKVNYFEILAQKEVYWKQRSKQHWLNSGDTNSKYFHSIASSRKRNNQIRQLKDSDGYWQTWDSGLERVVADYFTTLEPPH
uniref:DUF4283 domain-containing protein n=1 Tax=Cannabis sativa TaxID=3483 RepID=A0A803QIZ5_CANSA